jgi:alpha-mannosidase
VQAGDVPSLGYRAFPLVEAGPAEAAGDSGLTVTPEILENRYYRITLNRQGQIAGLFDKRCGREVLAPGARGNVLQAFEDKPLNFDAWDIDIYYQEKSREVTSLVEACVEETGPLRGVLRLRWRFYDSEITQRLTIYRDSPRIDFRTEVDWQERQVLLKAAFPVAVRATRATYDIQFGSVERPAHWNTSWDWARFETVGHKWVDLSEGNYGVSLLNDCKYGHDVKNNVLRLTLLKSAIEPDKEADLGPHEFTYSLLPHEGEWRQGGVVQEAYALNYPLLHAVLPAGKKGSLPPVYAFAELDAGQVIVETVKKAEQGEAWIVRVYEYQQSRSNQVTLKFGQRIQRAVECNLIEEEDRPVEFAGDSLRFPILPFEIKTFKIWF